MHTLSTGTFCTSGCTSLKKSLGNGISLSDYTSTFIITLIVFDLSMHLTCSHIMKHRLCAALEELSFYKSKKECYIQAKIWLYICDKVIRRKIL